MVRDELDLLNPLPKNTDRDISSSHLGVANLYTTITLQYGLEAIKFW